jgi:lysozyme
MILGIDVSQWQDARTFPWHTVHLQGIRFAYIRATVRARYDPLYLLHRQRARAAGLLTGSYHFLYPEPLSHFQAQAFARRYMDQDQRVCPESFERDELPPMLDVEAAGLTPAHVRHFLDAFAEETRTQCGIYTSRHKWHTLVGRGARWARPLHLWVADWKEGAQAPRLPGIWPTWTFWQFSRTGKIPGYRGPVCLDRYAGTYDQFLARYKPQPTRPDQPDLSVGAACSTDPLQTPATVKMPQVSAGTPGEENHVCPPPENSPS